MVMWGGYQSNGNSALRNFGGAGGVQAPTNLMPCIGTMNLARKSKAPQRWRTPKPGGSSSDCGQRASGIRVVHGKQCLNPPVWISPGQPASASQDRRCRATKLLVQRHEAGLHLARAHQVNTREQNPDKRRATAPLDAGILSGTAS